VPVSHNMFTHLKKLSTVQSNKGVHFLTPAAFPGSHCPMNAAARLAGSIQGLSSLVIGTQECAYYSRLVLREPYGRDGTLHWMYVLDANEVVFGCREGLGQALAEMDQAGAKTILLIVTCLPDLIGEDMEAIVYELQPKLGARLISISAPHFSCNGYPSGIWRTLEAIGSIMQRQAVIPRSVNLLGLQRVSSANAPLLRALSDADVTLRSLGPDSTMDEFLRAPDAVLNIVLSPYIAPLANRMTKDFGTPFVCLHDRYGIGDIDMAYARIGEILGLNWGDVFIDGRNTLLAAEGSVDGQFRDLGFFATDSTIDPIPLSAYLGTLGMKALLLHMEEFYQEDRHWAQVLHAQGHDPWICHRVNDLAEAPMFETLRPEFILGRVPALGWEIPYVDQLHQMNGTFGYERTAWLLAKMTQALSTPVPGMSEGVI
jgi:nitrogenase molybdenum-cofactor synthesis protein NifE